MPYLVCNKCRGYYQLQEGESPDDFQDKCQCGGDLEYVESMNIDSLEWTDREETDLEYTELEYGGLGEAELGDMGRGDPEPSGADLEDVGLGDADLGWADLEETENQENQYKFQNPQNPENHGQIDNFEVSGDEKELVTGVGSLQSNENNIQPNENKKRSLSTNLFRISAVMAVMVLLIISLGVITSKSDNYGAFNFNVYEKYNNEEINTFMESAFSPNDYGNSYDKVGKWNLNVVRIRVMGSPTSEDLKTLNNAVNDINTNVKDFRLEINDKNQLEPDMEIYFIPHSQFSQYSVNPSEVDGFALWKVSTSDIYGGNSAGEIYKARVFIGIDGLSQERRSHVIVHELAHGLGLHHNHNQKSVLCIDGPDLTEFSDLDKTMMRILYRKDIFPSMSRSQVENILNNSRENFF